METRLKVGALARRTGLTVRTLHHYDEIGLLTPSGRTASGHRLYSEEDVARLQQIASLRGLGVPLDEIRSVLARPRQTLERTLDLHVRRIDEQIERHTRLRARVVGLRDRLRAGEPVSLDDLTDTIELTVRYERYFSEESLGALEARRDAVGEERMLEAGREWAELFERFAEAMDAGLDPGSEEVAVLARRAAALVDEFTGGDPEIRASLTELYRAEDPERVMAGHGMSMPPGVWEYMGRARAALAER